MNATGILKKPTTARGNELKRPRGVGAGSGSEGEGAGSGGDMSDASRKKIKLKAGLPVSRNVSPGGSRAASPSRDANAAGAAVPKAVKTSEYFSAVCCRPILTRSSDGPALKMPTGEELKKTVPDAGVPLKHFTQEHKAFVSNPDTKAQFMQLVKTHFKMFEENGTKMLKPLKK